DALRRRGRTRQRARDHRCPARLRLAFAVARRPAVRGSGGRRRRLRSGRLGGALLALTAAVPFEAAVAIAVPVAAGPPPATAARARALAGMRRCGRLRDFGLGGLEERLVLRFLEAVRLVDLFDLFDVFDLVERFDRLDLLQVVGFGVGLFALAPAGARSLIPLAASLGRALLAVPPAFAPL